MGLSIAMKLVLLLTLFTIATTLAIQIASESGPDSDVGIPSKNISSPGGERSLLQRMLKGKHHRKGRHHRERKLKPRHHRERRPRLAAEEPVGNAAAVVAQDGSGNFPNIKAALDASLKRGGDGRFVIHIKSGVYSEHVVVTEAMKNVMFTGDGMGKTIITGSLSISGDRGTSESATVIIKGDGFVARDITFRNTAGPEKQQAPAITSSAPHSAFFRCGFEGYQDTIVAMRGQQFFKECDIYGTVDFICGDAAAIFQDCNLRLRRSPGRTITIAASSRNSANSPTGFVFHNCRVTAEPELSQVIGTHKIYLGRPWRSFARTIYIQNDLDVPIQAQGWMPWEKRPDGADANTVYYREYGNRGIGSSTGGRVKWPGYRVMDSNEASQFTVANLIQGHTWLPSTGVPFNAGL
ncbi:pectinesterase 2-like [Rhododendron vialii]|uniref:pectinesterase 2-like n=1 Tax=Rhododendron vialii TaxID=182163 RepID=UPI00265FB0F4|nr:pectinesterase 2-like [Rhododendron vialii]